MKNPTMETAKDALDTVKSTVSDNKLLFGSIAIVGGAAIFLLATDSGKRIRTEIEDRVLDLYDSISDQVGDLRDRMSERAEVHRNLRRVA